MSATGFVWDELYAWHDPGPGAAFLAADGPLQPGTFMDNPEPKRRLHSLLAVSGILAALRSIPARPATDEELGRVHEDAHVRAVRKVASAGGGQAGEETPIGSRGFEIAALAAGGSIAAIEGVLAGRVDNAYALVRPPGHHASADRSLGFCVFNNLAVAAAHALSVGLERVAIVDLDAHHGNGTQSIFWESAQVLTVSIHQENCFPHHSGSIEETGGGPGLGRNLNVPLPAGSGVGAYEAAMSRVVLPGLRGFDPELILVGCGFDASPQDPMARMMVHSDGFAALTLALREAAESICGGHVVFLQEGGYAPAYVPFCGLSTVEALSGEATKVRDPFLDGYEGMPGQRLQQHQDEAIAAAEESLGALARGGVPS